jgi:hypothetical protein
MPANFATKLSEGFAKRVLKVYFEDAVADEITNKDYEGQIKDNTSKLNILTFAKMTLKTYTGANLTADTPQESVATLVTDQQKAYYFAIKSLDTFKSWIDNPEGTLIDQNASLLQEAVDSFVLSFWADAAAGNWVGTNYTTGTVTVTTVTGAVTGVGTTFTVGMEGKPFKATGHTKWYRVKVGGFSSTTAIVIENDSDDETSAYDGGAIGGGTAYVIQANTALALTKTNIYATVVQCGILLDQAKAPKKGRFMVFPSQAKVALNAAPELIPAVPTAYGEVVKNGKIGMIDGMAIYINEQVAGDNTSGYKVLFGHKSFITFALGFVESGVEDLIGNFGKAYKGLTVYGGKVADERRKMGGMLFATFA